MLKKIICLLIVFPLLFLAVGCENDYLNNESTSKPTIQKDYWKKNPVDVISRYVENIKYNSRYDYVFMDVGGTFSSTNNKNKTKIEDKLSKSIKNAKLISVLPNKTQNNLTNPIEIKDKKGKTIKLKDPLAFTVDFEIKLNKNENTSSFGYDDGVNTKLFVLAKDNENNYKILYIGN